MFKKLALVTAAIIAIVGLAACTSEDSPTKSEPSKVVSYDGTWKAQDFQADIAGNSIVVNVVGEGATALYWKGTFPAVGQKVTSIADKQALSESLLGSQDDTKVFTVKDENQINFQMTMAGVTQTIELKRS